MTNKGIVTEVSGNMLTIVFERHEACGDCHACMHGSSDCNKHTLKIPGKAEVGDRVVVEMDESHVMAASAMSYLIPFAGFMLGLAAGWGIGVLIASVNRELIAALGAVLGTAMAYALMRRLDPHVSKGRWEPKVVSVSKPDEDEA